MACGDDSLARVALEVGFSEQAHLTRAFRHKDGLTPGQLKRR